MNRHFNCELEILDDQKNKIKRVKIIDISLYRYFI